MKCDHDTIRELFYNQIKELTRKSLTKSFDIQFSERWIQ